MKPDGKIQGVDVWVSQHGCCDWYISNYFNHTRESKWLCTDGIVRGGEQPHIPTKFFPSREAALVHLRELEAKEKPVIDLSTAKFGDKFVMKNGKVSPPYACPLLHEETLHLFQDGTTRTSGGNDPSTSNNYRDLVAPYTPPRTMEFFIGAFVRKDGAIDWFSYKSEAEARKAVAIDFRKPFSIRKITLTEGEGLAEPDVA